MASPSDWTGNPTVGAVRNWLVRYNPFIVTVAAIALIALLLPGRSNNSNGATTGITNGSATSTGSTEAAPVAAGTGVTAAGAAASAAAGNPGAQVQANTNVLSFQQAIKAGVPLEKHCDRRTGKIAMPSWGAPPCTQALVGSNGGSTWQGVTSKKIVVAAYVAQSDPAAQAILTAAGDSDTTAQSEQNTVEWAREYEAIFNTWGRTADIVFVNGSGAATDDAAAKADAIKVATQIKAFVSWGSPNNTYVNELVARHVMCMCTVELPNSFYTKWAPYVWSTLQSADHTGIMLEEYLLKRLNGRNAEWAGTSDATPLSLKKRVFGLLEYETSDYAYHQGTEKLAAKIRADGIPLKVVYFNGYPDLQDNQAQAQPDIQAMKSAGVTTIICGCDPFAPIFFTNEAAKQNYFPEWVDLGSALTDTTFFGRTYNPAEWKNAFGMGQLVARLPEQLGDNYRMYDWYYHHPPTARSGYGVIRAPIDLFYRGVHAAGPKLTPYTFQAGMFAQPDLGGGKKTVIDVGFGTKKYPYSAWTAFHDVTEIWWNPQDCGPDEVSAKNSCGGMWRYVAGGKRYLPGQIPTGEPDMFNTAGTVTIYSDYPPGEAPPNYPSFH
jgi:hypothetical protein